MTPIASFEISFLSVEFCSHFSLQFSADTSSNPPFSSPKFLHKAILTVPNAVSSKTPIFYFQFVTGSPLALSDSAKRDMGKIGLLVKYDGHWDVFVEVVERPVATFSKETVHVYQTPRKAIPMHPASFPKDAEDTTGGGNGKDGVGTPSECGTSRNANKKRKRKSEGESSESYEAGNGSKLSNASEEEVKEVDPEQLDYPDPEFSDFDKDRAESCFAVNQVWSIYDSCDGLPRYYARIKKVFSPGFKLQITWLDPDPDDEGENHWCDVDLPIACGKFTNGISIETEDLMFSHQISSMKSAGRSSYLIYPKRGETWALFMDWDIKWSSDPKKHKPPYKYEFVVVLTDFIENVGIVVAYLGKVEGFVSVFHYKRKNGVMSFIIAPGELYRFSHRIPSFRLTGKERVGVPEGSFELDPVSLPINDQI
ncbi:hypothetical protein LWI29_004654 [Acer saccharum]|uniref:DUF3444 domain-containing protein n=1 Tax=Acer saccharum TaxID=4024 RepID=A0AA39VUF9_ACESA|nr:hypothetical protein LWI29_004654 [Acer saccharum]